MKIISHGYFAVVASAGLIVVMITTPHHADAFISSTRASSPTARVKGGEINTLQVEMATPTSTQAKSTSPRTIKSTSPKPTVTTSSSKRTKKSTTKDKERVYSKNMPKKNVVKGSNTYNTKTFKPLKDLRLGSMVSGSVVDVCDFGAFINIGYATLGSRPGTALLHISQIQDKKIENIHNYLKKGDKIEGARVTTIDLNKGEVGLSLRPPRAKRRDFTELKLGDELTGKVDSVVSYGVFVDVGTNVNALLHISRITGGAIENVRQHLNEGDRVSVHVIDLDKQKKTVAVSMLDKKADQYLDRRMSQRLKRFYGAAAAEDRAIEEENESSDLHYFDQAIRELEEKLRERSEKKV
ncbi:hypothetical protein ACHAXA_001690 [Cyclostephanos tholiformis]|uniref:S1 motif domain-containing protein n=1 Tax=Cyclostephanos tholiformis TaxID=382380 RepID=A0ABD3RTP0_9STRA